MATAAMLASSSTISADSNHRAPAKLRSWRATSRRRGSGSQMPTASTTALSHSARHLPWACPCRVPICAIFKQPFPRVISVRPFRHFWGLAPSDRRPDAPSLSASQNIHARSTEMRFMRTRAGQSVLAVAIGASVLLGGVANAAGLIPGPDGVIHGCYRQDGGRLRVISADQLCERNETALPWNRQGPKGDKGDP